MSWPEFPEAKPTDAGSASMTLRVPLDDVYRVVAIRANYDGVGRLLRDGLVVELPAAIRPGDEVAVEWESLPIGEKPVVSVEIEEL